MVPIDVHVILKSSVLYQTIVNQLEKLIESIAGVDESGSVIQLNWIESHPYLQRRGENKKIVHLKVVNCVQFPLFMELVSLRSGSLLWETC